MSDFNLLEEAVADGFSYIRKSKGNVHGQYNGPCIIPSGCGGAGRDRLRIQPNVGKYGRFVCSICGTSGSGIDWLMLVRRMSKFEVLTYVGWQPADGSPLHTPQPKQGSADLCLSEKSEKWRINAFNLARLSHAKMNDETRTYLHERGITNEMIMLYALGLYDHYHKTDKRAWGNDKSGGMIIPRGIVVPWIDGEQEVRCVRVRRLPWDESDEARKYYGVDDSGNIGRYRALFGVDSSHFYNGHNIEAGCKVAVFEGEFTSIVAQDACKRQGIVCVATGSTSWCRNDTNLRLLASCSQVLICFDTDENQAGENASAWWLDRLKNAKRWRPLWGDANDMAMDGANVAEWLALGFEEEEQSAEVPPMSNESTDLDQLAPLPDPDAPDRVSCLSDACIVCGGPVEMFNEDGTPYCAGHLPEQRDLQSNPVVQEVARLFGDIQTLEMIRVNDWERRKAELLAETRAQLQQERKTITCRAVWCLNEKGEIAKAREHVAQTKECGSTRWSGAICAACSTPMPKEVMR